MIKIYKPTTPSRRKMSIVDTRGLTKKRPEKSLIRIKKKKSGRSCGKITVRHQGSGEKRYYRIIDFKRDRFDMKANVIALEYDPNRSARIALLEYEDKKKGYIIAPNELKIGDEVMSSKLQIEIKIGNCLPLKYIPTGIFIHNIELQPGKGAEIVRSAGTSALIQSMEGKYVQLKMPSKEIRLVLKECLATIGQVGNIDHNNIRIGKAGRKRHMGIRPSVRGKAMNPVDHPHGGGEGQCPIGLKHPKTPWGKCALGVKTRKKKKWSNKLIIQRRKK
ncbi:50S ribosomal protein L2 [Candidatus Kuenenbacteria bacterium HGW-Kuenenbacteria-1]|uniref:Large ribosomal subunit protein uL2 n=1 Tax=Candidatus Kuenenbacteria bacterium HGW-Kuenenbacteria-1 TaxID=2013812 RepID=A0A2N1UNK9_9BACT|nr:MAG: 50S ribosomal protein L2 [Candidatus Kuenenbacteria bacterium HGW-Kuenenbacteria-1]